MAKPREISQWPIAGERKVRCTLQSATITTDTMGGRTEPTWTDFGVWWVKATVAPAIVSDTQSAMLYALEGPFRTDLYSAFLAGAGLRAVGNGITLKIFQVENPLMLNRTLIAHCAPADRTQ